MTPSRHRLLRRRSLPRIRRNRNALLLQPRPRRRRRLQTANRLPVFQGQDLRPRLQPRRRRHPRKQSVRSPLQHHFKRQQPPRPRRVHSRRCPRSRQACRRRHEIHQASWHGPLLRSDDSRKTPAFSPPPWPSKQLHYHHRRRVRAPDPRLDGRRLVRDGSARIDEAVGIRLEAFESQSDFSWRGGDGALGWVAGE